MSEYQYYEFQAIDRPLTNEEMAELRKLSTRATITPTRFVNVYHYGDFRGDPPTLMKRYFDAFVYVANWGTHEFMLRLPRLVLDPEIAQRYCVADCVAIHTSGDDVILEVSSQDEDGGGWVDDEEAQGWLPSLIPLRAELANGDLRSLYLAWLSCAEAGMLDDDETEPPLPAGLDNLSAAQQAFAGFLRVGDDLIAVAAARPSDLPPPRTSSGDLERWIRDLPDAEKTTLLLRLVEGDEPYVRAELLRRFRLANATANPARIEPVTGGRTVAALISVAEERAEARRREQAEREAKERARREEEQARARVAYLDKLAGREDDIWREVGALIETKRPTDYDRAVALLTDLRDLSLRSQTSQEFATRLSNLRAQHVKKPSFLSRLKGAGL